MKKYCSILIPLFFPLVCMNNIYAQEDDVFQKFQEMKKQMMESFFSDSKTFMDDIDNNLFKSFGLGADLSGNLFKSRWQEDKDGRSFLITPQKNAELKIVVNDGFISIDATEKTEQGMSTSKVSLNVPEDLDWKKHNIAKKGEDIVVSFPYIAGANQGFNQSGKPLKINIDQSKPKKLKSEDDDTVPIVPNQNFDVI